LQEEPPSEFSGVLSGSILAQLAIKSLTIPSANLSLV